MSEWLDNGPPPWIDASDLPWGHLVLENTAPTMSELNHGVGPEWTMYHHWPTYDGSRFVYP